MKADLHIHSLHSNDGELSIPEIIKSCLESGVNTFSITDHNCIEGSREAKRLAALEEGINFIPGIEIDCNYKGTDLHLLGYQVDLRGSDFDALERKGRQKHMDAVPQMIHNLEQLGISIDRDELMHKSGGEPPTGELFAELLLMNPDQLSNPLLQPYLPGGARSDMPLINFYLDFFAQGKPAYVKIEHLDFKVAVDLVRSNGGIPVVAHPGLNLEGREEVAEELLDHGSSGLEVFNNYHHPDQAVSGVPGAKPDLDFGIQRKTGKAMKRAIFSTTLFFLLLVTGCNTRQADEAPGSRDVMELSLVQASHLAALPLACMQTTYPNKLGQTLGSEADIGEPQFLHPAFYGCFDWQSAIHTHWSLVKLLKIFPELGSAPQILHI